MSLATSTLQEVLVVGTPDQGDSHVRAWSLSGIRATLNRKNEWANLDGFVDICETDTRKRESLIRQAAKSKMKTILTGPISNNYAFTSKILGMVNDSSGISLLNPMKYNPLIVTAREMIAAGSIGTPRILTAETKYYDKALTDYALYHGLFDGISALEILLGSSPVVKVFSKKVLTDNSIFYVSLLNLADESICHLVAGTSSIESKLEFSLNGTGGLITFNERDASVSPLRPKEARTIKEAELLFHTFSVFLKNGADSQSLETYIVASAIEKSAAQNRPIFLGEKASG